MYKEIRAVSTAPGAIAKQRMLKQYEDVEGFKEVLKFIMSPHTVTGISEKKAFKLIKHSGMVRRLDITFKEAIDYFTECNTGTDRDILFAQAFMDSWAHDKDAHWLATGLVTKNLRIGVTLTTLNKVYGSDFIPKIGVMLGSNLKDVKNPEGPWIETEKLDGHRRIMLKENGKVTFYTRNGLVDNGLFVLLEDAAMLPDNRMYDGECLAIGNFKNSLELRQATNSIMNSDGPKTGITFNLFDTLPIEEYYSGKSNRTAVERKLTLCGIFGCESQKILCGVPAPKAEYEFTTIKNVPILAVVNSIKEALEIAKTIIDRGFEGAMLNKADSKYEVKRSKDLIKIKDVKTIELKVREVVEGTGKYVGMLGSVIVDYKGFPVGVGSGFNDYERKKYWENPDDIIGKIIEVDTFGETTNMAGSLSINAPIFKGVRYDKDTSD